MHPTHGQPPSGYHAPRAQYIITSTVDDLSREPYSYLRQRQDWNNHCTINVISEWLELVINLKTAKL
jgi:hypothetical protein